MTISQSITAIVLAGQRPGTDPLASAFNQTYKALIPLAGRPMLLYALDALKNAKDIGAIRIMAEESGPILALGDFDVAQSAGSIASTIAPLMHIMTGPMLITTADHALLTPEMIEDFVRGARGHDLAIGMVERGTLLASYPNSKRTWLRFRDGAYSGANLFWIGSTKIMPVLEIWRGVEQNRKKGRALIGAFGPLLLIGVLLRILSLRGALHHLGRRFGISIAPVILTQAQACIDVDTVDDHAHVEALLKARTHPS